MKSPNKNFLNKLIGQLLICVALIGVLVMLDKADFGLAEKTVAVFKTQIEKDYSVSEIVAETSSLSKSIIEKPAEIYANLMDRSGADSFIIPADQQTAAVFKQNSTDVDAAEKTMEFVSEQEIVVYAAKGGVVAEFILDEESETFTLTISHDDNMTTKYIGCSGIYVEELQRVKRGEIIASVNHGKLNRLEFEIWKKDKKVNPYDYIKI